MDMDERKEGTDWETKQILEILAEGDEPDLEMETEPAWHQAWMQIREHAASVNVGLVFIALALLCLICALAAVMTRKQTMPVRQATYVSTAKQETVSEETEAAPGQETWKTKENAGTEGSAENAAAAAQAEVDAVRKELEQAKEEYREFRKVIFGEQDQKSSLGCVTSITGFTDREKREIGFSEADFLKDAGAFLAGKQIQTKRIIIEDRIACSSDAGIAFQGRLEGKDDYILDVVFYPDLPGEYLFLLRSVKGNEQAAETQAAESSQQNTENNSAASTQNQNQVQTQPQAQQNQLVQQTQAVSQTQPASQPATENTSSDSGRSSDYDATSLAIKRIPETLLNYLDNRYEFQYSLYEYLFHHGKRDVKSASVTDYSVDGDTRTAMISLQLSDGSSMTAVYDKTANSYSFER